MATSDMWVVAIKRPAAEVEDNFKTCPVTLDDQVSRPTVSSMRVKN